MKHKSARTRVADEVDDDVSLSACIVLYNAGWVYSATYGDSPTPQTSLTSPVEVVMYEISGSGRGHKYDDNNTASSRTCRIGSFNVVLYIQW